MDLKLPSSGVVLGEVIDSLGLRGAIGQAPISDSTAGRVFDGKLVKQASLEEVVRQFVIALLPSDALLSFGVDADSVAEAQRAAVLALLEWLQQWDAHIARQQVVFRRSEDAARLVAPFLRLLALDIGMRAGAFVWLFARSGPSEEFPSRVQKADFFWMELERLRKDHSNKCSIAEFATAALTTERTLYGWKAGDYPPSPEILPDLALAIASKRRKGITRTPEEVEAEQRAAAGALIRLRIARGLKLAHTRLSQWLGPARVEDLLKGTIRTANHICAFIDKTIRPELRTTGAAEVLMFGARSKLGGVFARGTQTSNPILGHDLRSLTGDWSDRLYWWAKMVEGSARSDLLDIEALLDFFPTRPPCRTLPDLTKVDDARVLDVLAQQLGSSGEWRQAARLAEKAVSLEPNDATLHYNFAVALGRCQPPTCEDLERAWRECEAAIRLAPDYLAPAEEIGIFLIDLGRFDEAIAALNTVKPRALGVARVEYHLGLARMNQEKLEEAIAHYKEAIRLEPSYVDAWTNLSYCLLQTNHAKEARDAAKEAARLGDPAALNSMGRS